MTFYETINHGQKPKPYRNFVICILKFDLCIAFFVPTRRPGIFGSGLSGLGYKEDSMTGREKTLEIVKRLKKNILVSR